MLATVQKGKVKIKFVNKHLTTNLFKVWGAKILMEDSTTVSPTVHRKNSNLKKRSSTTRGVNLGLYEFSTQGI